MPAFFRRDDWHPTPLRRMEESPVFAHLDEAMIRKGWRMAEALCNSKGERLTSEQSIIIANARVDALRQGYGAIVRCPYEEHANADLWNTTSAAAVCDNRSPYSRRIR